MKLQGFSFKESSYERPNRKWRCGRKDGQCPCQQGPIEKPLLKHFSARCSQEENPCKPKRSIRAQRALLTLIVSSFSLALILFLLLSSSQKEAFIMPGPLSSHHSTIPQGKNCNACHSLSDEQWIVAAVTSHSRIDDSKNCLQCHHFNNQHLDEISKWLESGKKGHKPIDLSGLSPHNIKNPSSFAKGKEKFDHELACSSCHSEHQGANFDQKQMSDKRCQSCHEEKIDRFGKNHPDFVLYPYKKDNYVQYNHSSHETEFLKQGRKDLLGTPNCIKCHMRTADTAAVINHNTFPNVCKDCHSLGPVKIPTLSLQPVRRQSSQELKSLLLPEKDHFKTVTDFNNSSLHRHFNDKQLLWDTLQKKGDISSQIPQAEAVPQLATIPKSMIQELTQNYWNDLLYLNKAKNSAQPFFTATTWAIVDQLKKQHPYVEESDFLSPEKIQRIIWNDPILQKLFQHYFLSVELDAADDYRHLGQNCQKQKVQQLLKKVHSYYQSSGKTLRPVKLSIDQENPYINHLKEQKWFQESQKKKTILESLNHLMKDPQKLDKTLLKYLKDIQYSKALKSQTLPKLQSSSIHYKSYMSSLEKLMRKKTSLRKMATQLLNEGSSLQEFFLTKISHDKKTQKGFKSLTRLKYSKEGKWLYKKKEISLESYQLLMHVSLSLVIDRINEEQKSQLPPLDKMPIFKKSPHPNWMIQNNNSLVYQTSGHADPLLLQSYLHPELQKKILKVVKVKNKDFGLGSCQKCHSNISSERLENWVSPAPKKTLNKFSHGPHSRRCIECHEPRDASDTQFAKDYPGYNKDFKPMDKENCMQCHNPKGASDSCLQCHNYHSNDYDKNRREVMQLLKKYKQ